MQVQESRTTSTILSRTAIFFPQCLQGHVHLTRGHEQGQVQQISVLCISPTGESRYPPFRFFLPPTQDDHQRSHWPASTQQATVVTTTTPPGQYGRFLQHSAAFATTIPATTNAATDATLPQQMLQQPPQQMLQQPAQQQNLERRSLASVEHRCSIVAATNVATPDAANHATTRTTIIAAFGASYNAAITATHVATTTATTNAANIVASNATTHAPAVATTRRSTVTHSLLRSTTCCHGLPHLGSVCVRTSLAHGSRGSLLLQ